jgi:transmembrane sensor
METCRAGSNEEPALSLDPSEEQPVRGQVVEWLMRLQEAPADRRLRAEFEAWLAQSDDHRRAYSDMAPLWQQAEEIGSIRASRQPDDRAARLPKPGRLLKRRWAVAAGLALAASLVIFVLPAVRLWLAADHQTGVAELRDVLLQDGSRVTLDAQTAIAVDYTEGRRSVTLLSGQAFFEVMPSPARPFLVKADAVTVRVTGTAFDVAASKAGVAVAVRSGSVKVSEEGRGVVADLTGGQQVQLSRNGMVARGAVSSDDVGVWRDHRLVVYDRSIRDVVQQIARHTNAVILFGDSRIADQLVTATIDLRHPREALRAVVDLKYGQITEISPYLVVISSR